MTWALPNFTQTLHSMWYKKSYGGGTSLRSAMQLVLERKMFQTHVHVNTLGSKNRAFGDACWRLSRNKPIFTVHVDVPSKNALEDEDPFHDERFNGRLVARR